MVAENRCPSGSCTGTWSLFGSLPLEVWRRKPHNQINATCQKGDDKEDRAEAELCKGSKQRPAADPAGHRLLRASKSGARRREAGGAGRGSSGERRLPLRAGGHLRNGSSGSQESASSPPARCSSTHPPTSSRSVHAARSCQKFPPSAPLPP